MGHPTVPIMIDIPVLSNINSKLLPDYLSYHSLNLLKMHKMVK